MGRREVVGRPGWGRNSADVKILTCALQILEVLNPANGRVYSVAIFHSSNYMKDSFHPS